MRIEYDSKLRERAKEFRKAMTPQERKLWYCFARKYPVKIYRQREIKCFIVDFYCDAAKLVIEIDGTQHYTEQGLAADAERTDILEGCGLKVIRFTNREIDNQFDEVCYMIDLEIRSRMRE